MVKAQHRFSVCLASCLGLSTVTNADIRPGEGTRTFCGSDDLVEAWRSPLEIFVYECVLFFNLTLVPGSLARPAPMNVLYADRLLLGFMLCNEMPLSQIEDVLVHRISLMVTLGGSSNPGVVCICIWTMHLLQGRLRSFMTARLGGCAAAHGQFQDLACFFAAFGLSGLPKVGLSPRVSLDLGVSC